jgi:hypothetical protein
MMGTPFNFLNSINLAPTGLDRFRVTLVGINFLPENFDRFLLEIGLQTLKFE